MKKILIFFALIVWTQTFAQKNRMETKGFIGLSLGPAIPLGNFASKDLSNDEAGLANTGLDIAFANFGYRFGKNLGVSAAWLGGAHTLDLGDLSSSATPMWSYGSLLAGGLYSRNIGSSFLDGRALIGYSYAELSDSDDLQNSAESQLSIAYMMGVGIRPRIGNRFSLSFALDFFHTKAVFEEGDFEQPISSLFLNGGICYLFK